MPHLFIRSILAGGSNGRGGLVVLPPAWLKYYGLKIGDKLQLVTKGAVVKVRPLPGDADPTVKHKGGNIPIDIPHTFVRSIVKFAQSNGSVRLPLSWLEYYGLKTGDKVELVTKGDIVIRPLPGDVLEEKEQSPVKQPG